VCLKKSYAGSRLEQLPSAAQLLQENSAHRAANKRVFEDIQALHSALLLDDTTRSTDKLKGYASAATR
jgi:hypothetical protein